MLRNRYKITCPKLFPKPLKRLGILETKGQVILEPILNSLFENHLSFMKTHRGDVIETADSIILSGETPGFSSWVPKHDKAAIPFDGAPVRLLPWSGDIWPRRLVSLGYKRAEVSSYMELLDAEKIHSKSISSKKWLDAILSDLTKVSI